MGYKPVDDGEVCADVDECVDRPDFCSHYCNNTWGSFECSCSHGYILEPDGHSCKITGIYIKSKSKYMFLVVKRCKAVCIMQNIVVCYILSSKKIKVFRISKITFVTLQVKG